MATKKKTTKKKTTAKPEKPARNLSLALDLHALFRTNPTAARDKILAAFRESHGNAVHAATVLGIGHRTLLRYMEQDSGLEAGIEKLRTAAREAREKAAAKDRAEEAST